MEIRFNEKKVKKSENSGIRKKSLKYKIDTVYAIEWLGFMLAFIVLKILIRSIPISRNSLGMPIILCSGAALFSLIIAIRFFAGKNYKKIKEICQSEGIEFYELEKDCENALNFCSTPCIIGNKYMIISEKIYSFDKVCWAFYGYKNINQN